MNLIDWMLQDTVKLKGAIDARSHSRAKRIHPRKVTNELQACCVGEDSAKHVYWMFGGRQLVVGGMSL